jgi:hypothetical protein
MKKPGKINFLQIFSSKPDLRVFSPQTIPTDILMNPEDELPSRRKGEF